MPDLHRSTTTVSHDQLYEAAIALGLGHADWFDIKSIHITPDLVTVTRSSGRTTTLLAITHPDPCEVCDLERPADPEGPASA